MTYSKPAGVLIAASLAALSISGLARAQSAPSATEAADAAQPAEKAAVPAASVDKTKVGVLLDTPALREVFAKHFPEAVANPKLAQGRGMTLRQMQAFAPKEFTDERLSAMDADLKTLSHG